MWGYVSNYNSASNDLAPLLWCLGFVITDRELDFYLQGTFTGKGLCGGDPGWQLFPEKDDVGRPVLDESDKPMFYAWTDPDISGLNPHEGTYDEATVKKHVRATLENFRKAHPGRSPEVDKVIVRYEL